MMSRSFRALTVALSTMCAGAAIAEPLSQSGVIASIDSDKRQFTLESGDIFIAGPKVKLSTRRVGEEVLIRYSVRAGHLLAVKMKRAPVQLNVPAKN